jgi:hypothetical protein
MLHECTALPSGMKKVDIFTFVLTRTALLQEVSNRGSIIAKIYLILSSIEIKSSCCSISEVYLCMKFDNIV